MKDKIFLVFFIFFLNPVYGFTFDLDIVDKEESKETAVEINKFTKSFVAQKFVLLQHKTNFVMPFSFNNKPNNSPFDANLDSDLLAQRGDFVQPLEAEFQVSFKFLIEKNLFNTRGDLFLAYTQHAWWQLYNGSWSKPFRETNYNPEVFYRWNLKDTVSLDSLFMAGFDFGYMHESNGQINELSRSWDRIFLRAMWTTNIFRLVTTFWYRLPEKKADQNPDILDFLGPGELEFIFQPKKHEFRIVYIPGFKRSGVELSYSYPVSRDLRFYTKFNYGYGHSLIDYNHKVQRLGVGFSVADPISTFYRKLREGSN